MRDQAAETTRRIGFGLLLVAAMASALPESLVAQDEADNELRDGFLVRIPLPITGQVDQQVQATITRVLERLPAADRARKRPVLVLQFETGRGTSGQGSQFERCISLARFLTSPELSRVQTVAYLPAPKSSESTSTLSGHALLVALACEQWAMHDEARLGSVGVPASELDSLLVETYRSLGARRQVLPPAVIDGLVDSSRGIYRIESLDGTIDFYSREQEAQVVADGDVSKSDPLLEPGEVADFDSDTMFRYQLIGYRVKDRRDLARRLDVRPDAFEGDPSLQGAWAPIRVSIKGPIDQKLVSWMLASLESQVAQGTNLILLEIDSQGGAFRDGIRLAQWLADLNSLDVRTVAMVTGEAKGPAALVALACDHLVFQNEATIGGEALPALSDDDREALSSVLPDLASAKDRDLALIESLIDPTAVLEQYQNTATGETRFAIQGTPPVTEDTSSWELVGEVATSTGMTSEAASRYDIARYLVADRGEVQSIYQLSEAPEELQPTATFKGIERFARFLASPWISWWLLFGGMIFLSTEMSSPGLSVPGFLSAVCFLLFFWAQYLDGNAHWLEILLFLAGAVFLILEFFVLPGFGIFGVGGLIMVFVSIVLASQTFVWPSNSEEFAKLPGSLGMVFALVLGVAIPMMLVPKYLDRLPILKRLSLNPATDEAFAQVEQREVLAQLDFLKGKMGKTMTPLVPGGKVQFGDDVVSVVTDGRPIDAGESVVVREVRGHHVVVDPLDA